MGRFSVEFEVINHVDANNARSGFIKPGQVRRTRVSGVVDTGASSLVLPKDVVDQLGLPELDSAKVRYADGRRRTRPIVSDAQVELLGRTGTFSAIVEPDRTEALIGAIVLEELDFLIDPRTNKLVPRDPKQRISEIE